jgi:hypothetical protein
MRGNMYRQQKTSAAATAIPGMKNRENPDDERQNHHDGETQEGEEEAHLREQVPHLRLPTLAERQQDGLRVTGGHDGARIPRLTTPTTTMIRVFTTIGMMNFRVISQAV